MTTIYEDTTVDFVDLTSFYYGNFVATSENAAGATTTCTIMATCVSPSNTTIDSHTVICFLAAGAQQQQLLGANPV